MKKQYKEIVIGIDMGATHIRICLMDRNNNIISTAKEKTEKIIFPSFLDGLKKFISNFSSNYSIRNIIIGLPATISKDRKDILSIPNLKIDPNELSLLTDYLSNNFNCNVKLERDVNLQLIYDVIYSNLQQNLVLGCYLGTGLGFSIWHEGKIFTGANGVAGELGHIPYGDQELACTCGNYGCLETNCSGSALKYWYHKFSRDYLFEDIFIYANQDPFIKNYILRIAKATATCINLFDPNIVFFGGGVIEMKEFPYSLLIEYCSKYIRKPLPYNKLKILRSPTSALNGAIGACYQANQEE